MDIIYHKISIAIIIGVSAWALICIIANLLFLRYVRKTKKDLDRFWKENTHELPIWRKDLYKFPGKDIQQEPIKEIKLITTEGKEFSWKDITDLDLHLTYIGDRGVIITLNFFSLRKNHNHNYENFSI